MFGMFGSSPEFRSNELLDEAYNADSEEEKIEYAKQALKIYPDNIDAACFIANFEKNPVVKLSKFETIIEKASGKLKREGYFNKDKIGEFWGLIETRPYMRARNRKVLLLIELGRYTCAIKECEELLKLCESDNLGIRYHLIGLYCLLEKFNECKNLREQFNEESSTQLKFPMAIMYYKLGDYKKAKEILKQINEENPHIFELLKDNVYLTKNLEDVHYYSPGSIEEAILVTKGLSYLLGSIPSFYTFLERNFQLRKKYIKKGYKKRYKNSD